MTHLSTESLWNVLESLLFNGPRPLASPALHKSSRQTRASTNLYSTAAFPKFRETVFALEIRASATTENGNALNPRRLALLATHATSKRTKAVAETDIGIPHLGTGIHTTVLLSNKVQRSLSRHAQKVLTLVVYPRWRT